MGFKSFFTLDKWRVPEFTVVWSMFVDFLLLLNMLAQRFPCSLLPGEHNSALSVMIQMPLIQTHQDSCPFDVPLGVHSKRSHSYWCGTLWGSACIEDMCWGYRKGRKRKTILWAQAPWGNQIWLEKSRDLEGQQNSPEAPQTWWMPG